MDRPEIPNGLEASYEEMAEARQDVVSYVDAGKAYLDCHEPSPFVNNYIVRRLERVADAFNRERQRFIEARDTVAVN